MSDQKNRTDRSVPSAAAELVAFWKAAGREAWFGQDDAFDAALRERFGGLQEEAADGAFAEWSESPEGALALVLLLDQLPRNLYRKSPRAYATDGRALAVASAAIAAGYDRRVDEDLRPFFYLPFEHAETPGAQDRSVALTAAYARETGAGVRPPPR